MNLINFRGAPRRRVNQAASIFDEFFGRGFTDFFPNNFLGANPSVNVSEDEEGYMLEIAAPGLDRDDFSLEIKDSSLIVLVEKEGRAEENEENYLRREFNYSSFERQFQLPENVSTEDIAAKYDNGILVVSLPKREKETKAIKRIEIA